jgi:alkylhydroperoxidase/carboxymuconolactone decarboxylase family protein YurZ
LAVTIAGGRIVTRYTDEELDRGRTVMAQVYGFTVEVDAPQADVPYMRETLGKVFADIWARPELSIRERRLVTIGIAAAQGQTDLLKLHFAAAQANGELTQAQVDEIVVHIAYYAGWPNATLALDAAYGLKVAEPPTATV